MTAQKSTYATAYQEAADRLKKQVCKHLQWDEMQYAEYQYQTGVAYLYWYLPCDDYGRNQLERSKLYWNWFKSQWNTYDFEFLKDQTIQNINAKVLVGMYEFFHCPRTLAIEVKPNNVVLSEIKKKPNYESHTN